MLRIISTGLTATMAAVCLFSLSAGAAELHVPLMLGGANHAGAVLTYNLDNKKTTVAPMPGVPENISADPARHSTGDTTAGIVYDPARKKIYGHLSRGGLWSQGAIFEYTPGAENIRILHHFKPTHPKWSTRRVDTYLPQYAPTLHNDLLIGLTHNGGKDNQGVLYSFDLNEESYKVLHHFNRLGVTGGTPISEVLVASNGDYYGGSFQGPASSHADNGPLWRYQVDQAAMIVVPSSEAAAPRGQMVQRGGRGNIINISRDATSSLVIEETGLSGTPTKGEVWEDSISRIGHAARTLVRGSDGIIYGICELGAATGTEFGKGSLFSVEHGLRATIRHAFDSAINHPMSLVDGGNGLFYGSTYQGRADPGLIFEFDVGTRSLVPLHTGDLLPKTLLTGISMKFISAPIRIPNTTKLYGISVGGSLDASNEGVLYEYDLRTDVYTVKVDFGHPAGRKPLALMRHSNGKIYGTSKSGGIGSVSHGVFGGTTTDSEALGASFLLENSASTISPFSNPAYADYTRPNSQLVEGPDQKLYGIARRALGYRTTTQEQSSTSIYSLDPDTGAYALESGRYGVGGVIAASSDPAYLALHSTSPNSVLLEAGNQKYYGCTQHTCFEFDPVSKSHRTLHTFSLAAPDGAYPRGLVEGDDGILYGVTELGGANNFGVIFKMTVDAGGAAISILHEFIIAIDGGRPSTVPVFANGVLYGATIKGGKHDRGTYYSYTLGTNKFDVLHHFGSVNGEGGLPAGSVYLASDGKVYGTTSSGGTNDLGTLFSCELDAGNCAPVFAFTEASGFNGLPLVSNEGSSKEINTNFTQITELIRKPPCGLARGDNNVMLRDTAAEWLLKCNSRDPNLAEPKAAGDIYTEDVAQGDYNAGFIERLHNAQLTDGCNGDNSLYCPKAPVDKVQAVKLILKSAHRDTSAYKPPLASAAPYADVPMSDPDVDWIAQAKVENITNGCGDGSNFCQGEILTEAGFQTMLDGAF